MPNGRQAFAVPSRQGGFHVEGHGQTAKNLVAKFANEANDDCSPVAKVGDWFPCTADILRALYYSVWNCAECWSLKTGFKESRAIRAQHPLAEIERFGQKQLEAFRRLNRGKNL